MGLLVTCFTIVARINLNAMKNRLFIYAKDISLITGKGPRYVQRVLRNIRYVLKKEAHQLVTIQEFAAYIGVELSLIERICK